MNSQRLPQLGEFLHQYQCRGAHGMPSLCSHGSYSSFYDMGWVARGLPLLSLFLSCGLAVFALSLCLGHVVLGTRSSSMGLRRRRPTRSIDRLWFGVPSSPSASSTVS